MILVTYYALLFWWRALRVLFAVFVTHDEESMDAQMQLAMEAACNVITRGISPRLDVTFTSTVPDGSGAIFATNTPDVRMALKHFVETLDKWDEHDRLKREHAEAGR